MVKSLYRLALDTVCSHNISLLLVLGNEIPEHTKLEIMSIAFHDKKRNLLDIEKISDPTLFKTFKNTKLKCPSCASFLTEKSDLEAFYNIHWNNHRRRKRMRLAIDRQHFCSIDKKFVCENCKSVCGCYRRLVLCQTCKKEELSECGNCNGKCFSSCHQSHIHDSEEPPEDPRILCPLNKCVVACHICDKLVDLNCTLCIPREYTPLCEGCCEDSSSFEFSDLISSPELDQNDFIL